MSIGSALAALRGILPRIDISGFSHSFFPTIRSYIHTPALLIFVRKSLNIYSKINGEGTKMPGRNRIGGMQAALLVVLLVGGCPVDGGGEVSFLPGTWERGGDTLVFNGAAITGTIGGVPFEASYMYDKAAGRFSYLPKGAKLSVSGTVSVTDAALVFSLGDSPLSGVWSRREAPVWDGSPVPLAENVWANGEIGEDNLRGYDVFTIAVTGGITYYLWWNDTDNNASSGSNKTLDVKVRAGMHEPPEEHDAFFFDRDIPNNHSFIAPGDGTVYVTVYPGVAGAAGTYGIVYSTVNVKPTGSMLTVQRFTGTGSLTAYISIEPVTGENYLDVIQNNRYMAAGYAAGTYAIPLTWTSATTTGVFHILLDTGASLAGFACLNNVSFIGGSTAVDWNDFTLIAAP